MFNRCSVNAYAGIGLVDWAIRGQRVEALALLLRMNRGHWDCSPGEHGIILID